MNTSNTAANPFLGAGTRLLLRVLSRRSTYVAMGLGILLLDWVTGPFLLFPILFVIPVALSAWFCTARFAYALAVTLPIVRFLMMVFWESPTPLLDSAANGLIRILVLCLLAFFATRARETSELRERLRVLEGILPICSFCKDIRDEKGNWTKMESYISHRSEAQFTHSLCSRCAHKNYGDFMNVPERSLPNPETKTEIAG
jgi:hypothetical protein